MSEYQDQNEQSEEMTFKVIIVKIKNHLKYLSQKKRIVLYVMILGCTLGFVYAYFQKPTYTATLTFALEDEKGGGSSGLSGALGLASSFGFDVGSSGGGAFTGANLVELMKSRRLVEKTLLNPVIFEGKQISLAEMYIQTNQWRESWEKNNKELSLKLQFPPNANRVGFSVGQDSILGIIFDRLIKKNLTVAQRDKKISIISIDINTENELFSKFFAESLAKEVSDFYIETKSRKAKLNVDILEFQADSIRKELNDAINGVAIANDNTYNLNPALNTHRVPSSKKQVDVQANTAILTQLVTNLELAKVTLRKETPLIQIIDTPILPLKKAETGKLKSIIIGGIISVILAIFYLSGSYYFRKAME